MHPKNGSIANLKAFGDWLYKIAEGYKHWTHSDQLQLCTAETSGIGRAPSHLASYPKVCVRSMRAIQKYII